MGEKILGTLSRIQTFLPSPSPHLTSDCRNTQCHHLSEMCESKWACFFSWYPSLKGSKLQFCSAKSVILIHSPSNFEKYSFSVLYPLSLYSSKTFKTELFIFTPKSVFPLTLELAFLFSNIKIWKLPWYEVRKADFNTGYQQLPFVTNLFEFFYCLTKTRDNCTFGNYIV